MPLIAQHAVKHGSLGPEKWTNIPSGHPELKDDLTNHPSQYWMSTDLKQAILAGNCAAIVDARNKNQQDLQPNLTTIRNNDTPAAGFEQVTEESTGQDYFMCGSDSGWIWAWTISIDNQITADGVTGAQCVVQVGSWSKSSQILGISYQTFTNIPTEFTAVAAAAFVSYVVGNWIKNMILGAIYENTLKAALEAAAAGVVEANFMVDAAAAAFTATVIGTIGAGVVGALVAIIIFYISDFIHRSYGLTLNVYNWDTKASWTVGSWYGDNAVIAQENAGSGPWQVATLLPVQSKA